MAVTPRSRTASANSSPTKSNGRKPTRIAIDLSDEDEVEERKPAKGKSRASAAKVQIEVSSDDDDDDESGDEYEVEAIRGHRRAKGHESWKYEYFIKWKNWPEDDNTWEPEENLTSELVDDYWKSQPSKSQPKKFHQKRKALSDDEEEEIKDSNSDQVSVKPKANGRRASSSASRKPTSNRNSPAKKARTSTSGRRRAQSDSEDDEDDEDEDEDSDAADRRKELIAVNKIRDYFREHYIKKNPDWEDLVENIINMAREPKDSQLKSYVQFRQDPNWVRAMSKAGLPNKYAEKGPQMWVPNDIVNERCPQKVIKFYSQHVRFSNPTSNH